MKTLETKVDGIATGLKELTKTVGTISSDVRSLSAKVETLSSDVESVSASVGSLSTSVRILAERMDAGFNQARIDMEDLAAMTVREFGDVRKEMASGFENMRTSIYEDMETLLDEKMSLFSARTAELTK